MISRSHPTWMRVVATMLLVVMLAFAVGCYGSFPLTKAVYEFNGDVTDNSIGQSLLFWVFIILPVYGIAQLGDAVIFNLIEFWTGESLDIGQADMPSNSAVAMSQDGHTMTVSVLDAQGQPSQIATTEIAPGTFEIRSADGSLAGTVVRTAGGDLQISDAQGHPVQTLAAADIANL